MPGIGVHHPLEYPAQHVRPDRGTAGIVFLDGEVITLEQLVEGVSPEVIGEAWRPSPFQGMAIEQPAVQKRNPTEPERRSPARRGRPIQGSEEEGSQEPILDAAPTAEAPVELLPEETGSAIEPTPFLNEVEKEDPSQRQEPQPMPISSRNGPGQRLDGAVEEAAELVEKTVA